MSVFEESSFDLKFDRKLFLIGSTQTDQLLDLQISSRIRFRGRPCTRSSATIWARSSYEARPFWTWARGLAPFSTVRTCTAAMRGSSASRWTPSFVQSSEWSSISSSLTIESRWWTRTCWTAPSWCQQVTSSSCTTCSSFSFRTTTSERSGNFLSRTSRRERYWSPFRVSRRWLVVC